MTQGNTVNVKFSNSQLDELKSGIKIGTEVTLKLWSKIVHDFSDETNFPFKFLLTYTQVSRLRETFTNGSSANVKLSKTQLHKIGLTGTFSGRILGPLLNPGLSLMKNINCWCCCC